MKLVKVLWASYKARHRPPDFIFPFDVMSDSDKQKALERARSILQNPSNCSNNVLGLARWWVYYFDLE